MANAREIFGSPAPRKASTRSFYQQFKRKDDKPQLVIKSKDCKDCGGITTSVTRYMCAACHFRGWWPEVEEA